MRVLLIGTAFPYRGGLALYNERLMEEFRKAGEQVEIYTFRIQYPSFLFPGKTQYSDTKERQLYPIKRQINSINPLNWICTGLNLKRQKPDLVIIKYWLPFFAPCFGTIARIARKNGHTKVIAILDNVIPHEKRFFDSLFTRYFLRSVDSFVAMSQKVKTDLDSFDTKKPCVLTPHPLFDNFGRSVSRNQALDYLFEQSASVSRSNDTIRLLFFGLIREYKGLDLLLRALASEDLKPYPLHLVVAGEFYDDPKRYYDIVKTLDIESKVSFIPKFINDEDVKYYFCGSDLLILPYRDATQSGVTQIAYHFNLPMIVTNVGGLPEIVPNGKCGYVCEPTKEGIAASILKYCQTKPDFSQTLAEEKLKYSWEIMTQKIKTLYQNS
ncbi:MAG: glycosyltransferase [Bacteroidales bacterium]|jgi:glycosyltransferase involved in cell wall biosynthesis|nr:glycosyltransferase [Bacteroidales bacterium]